MCISFVDKLNAHVVLRRALSIMIHTVVMIMIYS